MSKRETFYTQQFAEVTTAFGVEYKKGLSDEEVKRRQTKHGLNIIPSGRKLSVFKLFLSQFKDVLIIVLIIAATVSWGVSFFESDGSPTEAFLIYGIVITIALVGFFNEYKAERTVEALKKLVSLSCKVRRGGEVLEVS